MGAMFSVALSQAVKIAVLRRNLLPVPSSFAGLLHSKIQPCRNIVIPYIDYINFIGTSAVKVNRDQLKATNALSSANLQVEAREIFTACGAPYKVAIGLAWWNDGALTVNPSHALRLFKGII